MKSRLFVTTLAVALFATCSKHELAAPDQARSQSPPEVARVGLAGYGEINTIDPVRAVTSAPLVVVWQLYDRLVGLDADDQPVPMIASRWASSDSLTRWTFQIASSASFNVPSGEAPRRITPADVKHSIERALRIPGYGQSLLAGLIIGGLEVSSGKSEEAPGIEAGSDSVTFHLTRPFAFLPQRLGTSVFGIVPGDTSADSDPLLSSGAYRLKAWDRLRGEVTLEAARPAAHFKSLLIQAFANEGTAVESFRTGAIDYLEASLTAKRLLPAAEPGLTVTMPPSNTIRFVALNQTDETIRHAPLLGTLLNVGTDRERLREILGGGEPLFGPVPGEEAVFHYDPERAAELARQLPASARHLRLLTEAEELSRRLAEGLKQQWTTLGLEVSLEEARADFVDRLVRGRFQLVNIYFGPFLPTPEQYLWPYQSVATPLPNLMAFKSPPFDAAFEAYTGTAQASEQAQRLRAALAVLKERPPVIWLLRTPSVVAYRPGFDVPRSCAIPVF